MKQKEYEVIYKFTAVPTVPFPSALNWNAEPIGELIRCKDCIYYRQGIDLCDEPHSIAHDVVHEGDYCSKAERKE